MAPQTEPDQRHRQVISFFIGTAILVVWLAALSWVFSRYGWGNYFLWYVKNGALISVATSFMGLIWDKLEEVQRGLVSLHPVRFMSSGLQLVGVFIQAVANILEEAKTRNAWDFICSMVMSLFMVLAVLVWFLVVAPGFYVLSLVTGAPSRCEIAGGGGGLMVVQSKPAGQPSAAPIPEKVVWISFADRPFALVNALNAAVLFLANLLISHSHLKLPMLAG
jgi:hypothetical protein